MLEKSPDYAEMPENFEILFSSLTERRPIFMFGHSATYNRSIKTAPTAELSGSLIKRPARSVNIY